MCWAMLLCHWTPAELYSHTPAAPLTSAHREVSERKPGEPWKNVRNPHGANDFCRKALLSLSRAGRGRSALSHPPTCVLSVSQVALKVLCIPGISLYHHVPSCPLTRTARSQSMSWSQERLSNSVWCLSLHPVLFPGPGFYLFL